MSRELKYSHSWARKTPAEPLACTRCGVPYASADGLRPCKGESETAMNVPAWAKQGVPIEILALKLCEEAAEVGTEVTDGWKRGEEIDRLKVLDELDHVIAIAGILKERLTT